MKVLHKGTNPADIAFSLLCNKCGTIVELTQKELKSGPQGDFGNYVECPVCSAFVYDSTQSRHAAVTKLAQLNEPKMLRETRSEHTYRDTHDDYVDGGRSGGPTGPLPPPELPHFVKTTKRLAGV